MTTAASAPTSTPKSSPAPNRPVEHSLAGKHLLITGTTGFLGKVILEKLIRDLPQVGGIYLLIRGNRHYPTARERFIAEVMSSSVFSTLRQRNRAAFERFLQEKVHCLTGEVTEANFGMKAEAFQQLADRLDLIVHSAASVNFRERMDVALSINTLCLHNIVALSAAGGAIPVLQVSTCYVNGFQRGSIYETFNPPAREELPKDADGLYDIEPLVAELQGKIAELEKDYQGRALAEQLVLLGERESRRHGWNDTYTFTKWLGEQYLRKALKGKALTVVRPAIIESTLKEPTPGWIEGVKVADAVLLAYARQKVVFFPGKRSGVIDVIPADLVANAVILAGAELLSAAPCHRIYQACSGARNPLLLGDFVDHLMREAQENHMTYEKLFEVEPRKPFKVINRKLFDVSLFLLCRTLSTRDKTLKLMGRNQPSRLLRNLNAMNKLAEIFAFYATPNYVFHSEQLQSLGRRMGETGRDARFPVDAAVIDWEHYIRKVHIAGLNSYALNDGKPSPRKSSSQTSTKTGGKGQQAA
ncbi:nucleoside-diphosphate-sugar epimerase [Litorivivens lipolytica]|uniref:Nucleoside-diphosphate-sugar epimerase n=1 Tax=Litorivivens lipolytica TaxID=1524264 RepID=A0A7W4W5J2_9GAMM|nr:fatty acyl-CoA reductase [Litorivivens lipolytica]MBB3047876.1 nucleoside-diphosphate-sugar epimerase [Litorivivens lipolytica]